MKSPFTDEIVDTLFNYYLEHQEELVKEYDGKYLIIIREGEKDYSQRFYTSRVVF